MKGYAKAQLPGYLKDGYVDPNVGRQNLVHRPEDLTTRSGVVTEEDKRRWAKDAKHDSHKHATDDNDLGFKPHDYHGGNAKS